MRNKPLINIYIKKDGKGNYSAECSDYPEFNCTGRTQDEAKDKIIPLILKEEEVRHPKIVYDASTSPKKIKLGF